MRSSQHQSLSRAVRTSFELHEAWNHVSERAKNSRDERTRADVSLFSEDVTHHLRKLQTDLRSDKHKFSPQHGYAKERGPKKRARPIVVATIKDRIIQRSILCVCQSKKKSIASRLGKIPQILATPTSVGGIPGKGAEDAGKLISNAINGGATWFVRTDIKDFFTRISKQSIRTFLSENVEDEKFIELFMGALNVELENEDEVRDILDLFPFGDSGVAQGSALSALCANIVLYELDRKTNGRGVTTIRYLDDILVLGPTKVSVEKVWTQIKLFLTTLGMEAHDPAGRNSKADMGKVSAGFDFLSLTFQAHEIFPSRKAKNHLLASVRAEISTAKRKIDASRSSPRRSQRHFAQSLAVLDLKIRGWGDAFAMTTKRIVFAKLDESLSEIFDRYISWYLSKIRNTTREQRMRMLGVTLLVDTPRR